MSCSGDGGGGKKVWRARGGKLCRARFAVGVVVCGVMGSGGYVGCGGYVGFGGWVWGIGGFERWVGCSRITRVH